MSQRQQPENSSRPMEQRGLPGFIETIVEQDQVSGNISTNNFETKLNWKDKLHSNHVGRRAEYPNWEDIPHKK